MQQERRGQTLVQKPKNLFHIRIHVGKQASVRETAVMYETDREKAPRFSRHFSPQDEERQNGWGIGFARF